MKNSVLITGVAGLLGANLAEHREPRNEVKWAVPTYQKSIDILDYKDVTNLKTGLTKMWENYEITDGLYSYWK